MELAGGSSEHQPKLRDTRNPVGPEPSRPPRRRPLPHAQRCLFPPGDSGGPECYLVLRVQMGLGPHTCKLQTEKHQGWLHIWFRARPSPLQKAGWPVYPASAAVQGCVQSLETHGPILRAPLGSVGRGQAKRPELGHVMHSV